MRRSCGDVFSLEPLSFLLSGCGDLQSWRIPSWEFPPGLETKKPGIGKGEPEVTTVLARAETTRASASQRLVVEDPYNPKLTHLALERPACQWNFNLLTTAETSTSSKNIGATCKLLRTAHLNCANLCTSLTYRAHRIAAQPNRDRGIKRGAPKRAQVSGGTTFKNNRFSRTNSISSPISASEARR